MTAVCCYMQGRKHAELDRDDVRTLLQHQLEVRSAFGHVCTRKTFHARQQWVLDVVLHVSQEAVVLPAVVLGVACLVAQYVFALGREIKARISSSATRCVWRAAWPTNPCAVVPPRPARCAWRATHSCAGPPCVR